MRKNDMTFRIEGEAGQGVESGGAGFAKSMARSGLHVFGMQDYMSRIRGGHNYYQVRVAETPLHSHTAKVDVLMALLPGSIERHKESIVPGGAVIYDQDFEVDEEDLKSRKISAFPVPLFDIAKEADGKIMANTACFGAAAGVTGFPFEVMASVIRDNFAKKGDKVIQSNLQTAEKAYQYTQRRYSSSFDYRLEPVDAPPRMVINGNQAFSLGALLGGCRFISAYPMTPSTGIIEWMAGHSHRYDVVAKHTEDELAAILMAIGANFAGVRGMAATSGGGFSLMVEALGLAGMTETPVVILEAQRPGPSTGMPTRTEQGDLLFILHASQGEFPRVVLAPGTIEECFHFGWRAFNLADKYQCPVIVISDNFMANSVRSIEKSDFHFEEVAVDRGDLLTKEDLDQLQGDYHRYAFTETGISPRALPGHPNAVFQACSDEHDESGHFADEDAENRVKMVKKRLRKLDAAREEMRGPSLYGPDQAEVTLVGWGSTYGALRETVDRLDGKANLLHFTDLWPLPVDRVRPYLEKASWLVSVENNATGQFARLLQAYAGVETNQQISAFDGRPFSPEYILDRLG
jgi:2-oxoglutarate ferredoxin oxidoreductase subunit alpha